MRQTDVHKGLVIKARDWLAGTNRCNPVFTERGSQRINEFPDAIGWDSQDCIVVECKASLDDFRADKKKVCRNGEGLGSMRYFLIPAALQGIIEKELPDGWGLIVANEHGTIRGSRSNSMSLNTLGIIKQKCFICVRGFLKFNDSENED